ncbi:MAG: helix-turn-helix transcriptional regulator [Solirubrobacterales bacterium]|nr:helix-turn-helix transcriptional regulator [Solirubrobacterales bacterium]
MDKPQKDPDLVALGERVRALRLKAELTQEALADSADLHWTFVGQVERGERNISYKNILKLAAGLSAPARELLP